MGSWIERDIASTTAKMLAADARQDPYRRMAEKLKATGPLPRDPSLGFIANMIRQEPSIVDRITDEGFDARVAGKSLDDNPYVADGQYGWWRDGWFAADDNLRGEDNA